MKNSMIRFALFGIAVIVLFQSCLKDDCSLKRTYTRYDPVYITLSELRSGLKLQDQQELKSPGKIYVYGDYLLVNEIKQGIHIYDNANPANPIKINFIEIPGNVDMAVRDGILYADNYVDLLAIDIKDPQHPNLICRSENVFSPISIDPIRGMLVDYNRREETITLDCNSENFNAFRFFEGDVMFDASGPSTNLPGSKTGNFTGLSGIGGSMARFTITSDYLYTVDMSNLYSFFVDAACPVLKNKVQIGWNIETIFTYDDKLFIGSTSGMFIYVLNNPATPAFAGSMNHLRSCDPVIVQGDYAYVTLHGGSPCGGFTNQLDIVDVKNIFNPQLVKSHTLEYPLGLGIHDNYLFICDNALKVFKLESGFDIKLEASIPQHNPYDVIVLPDRDNLILISESGIYQYNISKAPVLNQLSFIPVN
jgi:hypothetical protein